MKKGLIVTMSTQKNNSIQYTMQDQLYLPRLKNYLAIEYSAFEWENKASFELTEETIQDYDAVAITALTRKYAKQLTSWKPSLQVISVAQEQFMHSFAPRSYVAGMTTGYVLIEGPAVTVQGSPADRSSATYSEQELRKLMRAYPAIYWEVISFNGLKEKLSEKTEGITVALAPPALAYKKFIANSFPGVSIINTKDVLDPLEKYGNPQKDELLMIAICSVTAILLTLMVLFR